MVSSTYFHIIKEKKLFKDFFLSVCLFPTSSGLAENLPQFVMNSEMCSFLIIKIKPWHMHNEP